ncbi:MAG TPA: hypothetical protein VFZ41_05700 [Solirubrobacterales bacterium]
MRRVVLVVAAAAMLAASVADADVFGGANVRATFKGRLEPRSLPRSEPAPVALHLKGRLWTTDGKPPPQLRRLTIAINRFGNVSTRGLRACRRGAIDARTSAAALAACRDSVVGSGRFSAHIAIPSQAPFPARGRMLAFFSRQKGRRVILAHIFGREPVPTSNVLTLRFQRSAPGAFDTTMSLLLPNVGEDWGHVTGFELNLHRRYTYRGKKHSLITASCPAPKGFGSAVFAAAKGTYHLADGRVISRVVTGRCRVSR